LPTRFTAAADGRHYDALLARRVLVLDATPEVLRRVLPFARADHPAFASVLACDATSLWIEALDGAPLERIPSADEIAELGEALERLHRAGGVHGAVNRSHVVEQGGMLRLPIALDPPETTAADDMAGLEALGR
jgi:hypothetical protein